MPHAIRSGPLCLVPLLLAAPMAAQASACRPADAGSSQFIRHVTRVLRGTDAASVGVRNALQLPQISPDQVTLVTDNRICSKIIAPYYAVCSYGPNATGPGEVPSNQLYVLKVGTVYLATDPALEAGEWGLVASLDRKYVVLSHGLF